MTEQQNEQGLRKDKFGVVVKHITESLCNDVSELQRICEHQYVMINQLKTQYSDLESQVQYLYQCLGMHDTLIQKVYGMETDFDASQERNFFVEHRPTT